MADKQVGSLIISLEARTAQIQQDMAQTKKIVGDAMTNVQRDSKRAAEAMSETADAAHDLRTAGAAIAGGFALDVVKDVVIDVARALNQAQIASDKLQKSLFYANGGNLQAISADVEWLRKVAYDLGQEFSVASASYADFAGAVKGTPLAPIAREIFDALATSNNAFGKSAEEAQGIMLALVQMSAKGVVSAEEFRGQLAERLPVATQAAAAALNVTTGEFSKMLESGEILADDFLPKFARELKKMSQDAANFGGEAQKASAQFTNSWEDMKKEVAASGTSAFISGQLGILTDAFNDFSASVRKARADGSGFWGQTAAGGGAALRFLNPVNAAHYTAQSDQGRIQQLKQLVADKEKGLWEWSITETLASKQQSLAALKSELAGLEKRVAAVGKEVNAGQKKSEADAAALKNAQSRAKNYVESGKHLTEKERQTKALSDEESEFKAAVVGLNKGSKEYLAALSAHEQRKASLVESFGKKGRAAAARTAAKEARDAVREAENYGDLLNRLSGISSSYNNDLDRLSKAYGDGRLTLEQYRHEVEQLILTQTDIGKAAKAVDDYLAQGTLIRKESAAQLAIEYQLYGQSADARDIAMVAIKAQTEAESELARLKKAGLPVSEAQIEQINAEAAARAKVEQATLGQSKALGYAQQLAAENRRFAAESIFDERERAYAILQIEAETWRERIELAGAGTEAQKKLQEEFGTWYANQLNKPAIDQWKKSVEQYDAIFRQGFADMVNGGKATWKSFTKSLTTTFKTSVADQIYKMFAQPFVVRLVGSLLGVTGSGAALASAGSAAAGGAVGLGGIADLLSTGKSLFDMYNGSSMSIGGMVGKAGGYLSQAGAYFGNSSVGAFGNGMGMSVAEAQSYYDLAAATGADTAYSSAQLSGAQSGSTAQTAGEALAWAKVGYDVYRSAKTGEGWGATVGAAIGTYILPGIGTMIGSYLGGMVDSATGGGGGPKVGGNYNAAYSASGQTTASQFAGGYTPDQADGSLKQTLDAFNVRYRELAAMLGGTAQDITANLGFDSDPSGSAGDRVSASVALGSVGSESALRQQALFSWTDKGFSQGEAEKGIGEAIARMMIGALQQSDLPAAYANFLNGINVNTAPLEQLNAAIENVQALRRIDLLFDGLARVFPQLASAGLDARQAIVGFAGGLESLTSGMNAYYDGFFTDAEKRARVLGEVSDALIKVGQSLPATRDAFRAQVEALDLTTASGQKTYAAMMSVSGAFASVIDVTKEDIDANAQALLSAALVRSQLAPALDVATLKTRLLGTALVSTYSAAGSVSRLFLDVNSGLITFGGGAEALVPTLTGAQQAADVLTTQIVDLRDAAGGATIDFAGLSRALKTVDTGTFVTTLGKAFENLATRIGSVIDGIGSERIAVREAALQMVDPTVMSKAAIESAVSHIETALPSADVVTRTAAALVQAESTAKSTLDSAVAARDTEQARIDEANRGWANRIGGVSVGGYAYNGSEQVDEYYRLLKAMGAQDAGSSVWSSGRNSTANFALKDGYQFLLDGTAIGQTLSLSHGQDWVSANGTGWGRYDRDIGVYEYKAQGTEVVDPSYQQAIDQAQADGRDAVTAAEQAAGQAQLAYADALQNFAIDAGKSVAKLSRLREETVKYYQAQKALADLMASSAAGLRGTVADYRFDQLTPEQQFTQLQSDYAKAYAMALSTDGETLAGYGDKLNSMLDPLLDKAREVLGSDTAYSAFAATALARAEAIASRLDTLKPVDYQADSLDMLGSIDASLAALDASSRSAEQMIVSAIDGSRDQTVAGLHAVVAALTGQTVPAFATGGLHAGGLRLVGENGPELEVTGPSRIYTASQTRALLRGAGDGGSNAELLAELRALRSEVASLRQEARATAANTGKTARQLERFDVDGLTVRTDADTPLHTEVVTP